MDEFSNNIVVSDELATSNSAKPRLCVRLNFHTMKSHNSLKIVSLETDVKETETTVFFEAKMKAELKFLCPETGINFKNVFFSAVGRGNTAIESVIESVQNFDVGLMDVVPQYYKTDEIKCVAQHESIDHFEIDLPSPYPELFEKYVDLTVWQNHLPRLLGS